MQPEDSLGICGYLTKKGQKVQSWKTRFFKLDIRKQRLRYFTSDRETSREEKGFIQIYSSTIVVEGDHSQMKSQTFRLATRMSTKNLNRTQYVFSIVNNDRVLVLQARALDEMHRWIQTLGLFIEKLKSNRSIVMKTNRSKSSPEIRRNNRQVPSDTASSAHSSISRGPAGTTSTVRSSERSTMRSLMAEQQSDAMNVPTPQTYGFSPSTRSTINSTRQSPPNDGPITYGLSPAGGQPSSPPRNGPITYGLSPVDGTAGSPPKNEPVVYGMSPVVLPPQPHGTAGSPPKNEPVVYGMSPVVLPPQPQSGKLVASTSAGMYERSPVVEQDARNSDMDLPSPSPPLQTLTPIEKFVQKPWMGEFDNDQWEQWYLGPISRADAEAHLNANTDVKFIIRDSSRSPNSYAASFLKKPKNLPEHVLLVPSTEHGFGYDFDGKHYSTFKEVITYLTNTL